MHSNPYYLPPRLPPLFQERRRRRGESEPDWVMAGGDASASPSSDSSDIDDGEVKADVKADGEASKEVKSKVEVSSDGAEGLTSNAAAVVAVGAEGLTKNPLALRRDSDHSLEL